MEFFYLSYVFLNMTSEFSSKVFQPVGKGKRSMTLLGMGWAGNIQKGFSVGNGGSQIWDWKTSIAGYRRWVMRIDKLYLFSTYTYNLKNDKITSMNIELSLSCQILSQKQTLQIVMTSMINSNRSFIVKQQRCGCIDHELAYQKLKMITSCSNQKEGIYGIKIWAADDVITPSVLDVRNFNVVLKEGDIDVDVGGSKNSVVVREVEEIEQIFGMSLFQLQKRCKVEYLMRISHWKYQVDQAKCTIKKIAQKLMEKRRKRSLLQLLSFMRYHKQKRQNWLKNYFTIWVISYYQGNLSVLNEKVVKQKYFTSQTDRSLLSLCFISWRKMLQS